MWGWSPWCFSAHSCIWRWSGRADRFSLASWYCVDGACWVPELIRHHRYRYESLLWERLWRVRLRWELIVGRKWLEWLWVELLLDLLREMWWRRE